jgi:pimeloyl-ACP methyl ester carboxylesterase
VSRFLVLALVVASVLVACGDDDDGGTGAPAGPAAENRVTPVVEADSFTFTNGEGLLLTGRAFDGGGSTAVILAHMFPADQESWAPFAQDLRDAGYRAYTFNFRGYPGSEGERDAAGFDDDLAAAVQYVSAQPGVQRIVLVGASAGGTAAIAVATSPPPGAPLAGVLALSAPLSFEGLEYAADGPVGLPVLLIASELDPGAIEAAEEIAEVVDGETEVYPGGAHGTDMLGGAQGADLRARVVEFIESVQ